MDHDRSEGEGVRPELYTAVKIKIVDMPVEYRNKFENAVGNRSKYLIAIVNDIESLSDKTNVVLQKSSRYRAVLSADDSVYFICSRACSNMAYQDLLNEEYSKIWQDVSKSHGDPYQYLEESKNSSKRFQGGTFFGNEFTGAKVITPMGEEVEVHSVDDNAVGNAVCTFVK